MLILNSQEDDMSDNEFDGIQVDDSFASNNIEELLGNQAYTKL